MTTFGIVGTLIASIIAYLIGSVSWSVILGKCFFKLDVRKFYSHNAGATNASRVFGKKIGVLVLFLDMLKVPIAMLITMGISVIHSGNVNFGSTSYYIPGVFAVIGHCFPIYFKFKGGKAVSTFIGLTWMVNPIYFLVWTVTWWTLFFIWKRVSLSGVIGAIMVFSLAWIPQFSGLTYLSTDGVQILNSHFIWFNQAHNLNFTGYADNIIVVNLCITISGILLILKHHQNIIRLIERREPRYNVKDKSYVAQNKTQTTASNNPETNKNLSPEQR